MKKLDPIIPPALIFNQKNFPAEVLYEITSLATKLPFGIAIADIELSARHFHKKTIETYTVVQGDLEVTLDGKKHLLHPGDAIKIQPGMIHTARSISEKPARIVVVCIPEFSLEDYIPVKNK
jgi:mannose-6-phosphate isomerase-like protein (cupin superfamily)